MTKTGIVQDPSTENFHYRGRIFQTFSAARWAEFFDQCLIPWIHFRSGLVQFYLPTLHCYLCLDREYPEVESSCRSFRDLHWAVFLLEYPDLKPEQNVEGALYCYDLTDSSGGSGDFEGYLQLGLSHAQFVLPGGTRSRTYYADCVFTEMLDVIE